MKWKKTRPAVSQKHVNAATLELHFGNNLKVIISVKIKKNHNFKKSVIVKLLFNESCIDVGHGFTV